VVFRLDVHEQRPLPRRADLLVPIFPQGGRAGTGREPLWRLISVASAGDDLILLSAVGEVLRLGADGALRLVARLPAGHYHRTNLAVGTRRKRVRVRRVSDPTDLPDLAFGRGQHRRHRAG
jgi:hypothetical protein